MSDLHTIWVRVRDPRTVCHQARPVAVSTALHTSFHEHVGEVKCMSSTPIRTYISGPCRSHFVMWQAALIDVVGAKASERPGEFTFYMWKSRYKLPKNPTTRTVQTVLVKNLMTSNEGGAQGKIIDRNASKVCKMPGAAGLIN